MIVFRYLLCFVVAVVQTLSITKPERVLARERMVPNQRQSRIQSSCAFWYFTIEYGQEVCHSLFIVKKYLVSFTVIKADNNLSLTLSTSHYEKKITYFFLFSSMRTKTGTPLVSGKMAADQKARDLCVRI